MTTIHNCGDCGTENNIDCATCKLAFLNEKKKKPNKEEIDDDYSISEKMTEEKGDNMILILCIMAFAILAFVVMFMKLLK